MKGFKKLALVAAISAAPFAQAELTSIDDSALSDMTGQAGISIDLSANVSIGSIIYTDTDGLDVDGSTGPFVAGAGSLGINNIVLGGDGGGSLDNIKIDIDVDATAGLIIHLGATNTADVLSGNDDTFAVDGRDHQRVDFGLSVGDVVLNNSATLASGISIGGNLGPIDVVIANDGKISVDAYFEVTSGSLDIDVLGLGITNLTIGDDNSPITTGTYASAMTAAQAAAVTSKAALITGSGDLAESNASITDIDDGAGGAPDGLDDVTGLNLADTQAAARTDAEADATATVEAGAIAGVSNMAYVGMTISAVSTGYLSTSTFQPVEVANALNITIDAMQMDIGMDLTMGETVTRDSGTGAIVSTVARSLGSVAINDLNLSGTSLTIYGH